MHKGPVSRRAFAVLGAKMLCCGMGVNQSRLIRAMHGQPRGQQGGRRRNSRQPQRYQRGFQSRGRQVVSGPRKNNANDLTVTGFSPVRHRPGGGFVQTIYGTNFNSVASPTVRLGSITLFTTSSERYDNKIMVTVPTSHGIIVSQNNELFLTGFREGEALTWVFGPGDVGGPSRGVAGPVPGRRSRYRFGAHPQGAQQAAPQTAQMTGRARAGMARHTNVLHRG